MHFPRLSLRCAAPSPPRPAPAHTPRPFLPTRRRRSYAPWCGVCRSIGPEFARAAELALTHLPGVAFGAVNSDASPALTDSLGVATFPRFLLYRSGGGPEAFPLVATAEAFVAGLARMLEVPGAEALSPAKEFLEDGAGAADLAAWLFWRGKEGGRLESTLVLYAPPAAGCGSDAAVAADGSAAVAAAAEGTCSLSSSSGSAAAAAPLALEAAFQAAAGELMKDATLRFAVVRSASAMAEFEVPAAAPSLVFYTDHDEGRFEYSGAPEPAAIAAWVKRNNVPLVTLVTHKTLGRVRRDAAVLGMVFLEEPQSEHAPTLTAAKAALAGAVAALEAEGTLARGAFTLGVTNGKKYSAWMAHYGAPVGALPAVGAEVVAAGGEGGARYAMADAGGAWAREALCGAEAVARVGVAGKWRVVLSHECGREAMEAALEVVRGQLLAAGEEEEARELSPRVNDPAEQFPVALYVNALALPVEAVAAWLRRLLRGELSPSAGAAAGGYAA